jgi:SAM-dependent methyltransferase
MLYSYQDPKAGRQYGEFSASQDGQMQHQLILDSLKPLLPKLKAAAILDAGCGDGWLAGKLFGIYPQIQGFDISQTLIVTAKQNYPGVKFAVADAAGKLPYAPNSFDQIIANLLLHNLENQQQAYNNFYSLLKPAGRLAVVSVNPYYGYPVGVWKRSLPGRLLNKKPQLKLRPYFKFTDIARSQAWSGKNIPLRFSPLPEQLTCALTAGFKLKSMQDLRMAGANDGYNFNYRNSQFPLLLLLDFQKN